MSIASLLPFLAIYTALFLLRRPLGAFLSISATVVTVIVQLNVGISPPLPGHVTSLFVGFILFAAFLYVTASKDILEAFVAPIRRLVLTESRWPIVVALLVVIPLLVGWRVYESSLPDTGAPAVFRTVHPAPPGKVTANGETIDTKVGLNPLRKLKREDPEAFAQHLLEGRRVYYENCYFCHGDELDADGHFAEGVNPRPISFRDTTTIAMFTETFLFWRIAKGGPGLPDASTPWNSAMPAWEDFLTNEEIWQVILYLYDRTRQDPRAVAAGGH